MKYTYEESLREKKQNKTKHHLQFLKQKYCDKHMNRMNFGVCHSEIATV